MQLPNIYVSVSFATETSRFNLMGFVAYRKDFPSMNDEEIKVTLTDRYTKQFEEEQGHTIDWINISFID